MSDSDFADLHGKEFERADMTGARFTTVSLNGATFRACELPPEMLHASVDGEWSFIQTLCRTTVTRAPRSTRRSPCGWRRWR